MKRRPPADPTLCPDTGLPYHVIRPGTHAARRWLAFWDANDTEPFLRHQLRRGRTVTLPTEFPPVTGQQSIDFDMGEMPE